jgi:hypothetical protein
MHDDASLSFRASAEHNAHVSRPSPYRTKRSIKKSVGSDGELPRHDRDT